MKQTKKSKRIAARGFTIIEVLIVLAIAGLIMLVVFLAVPALQRVQRNNERKHAAEFAAVSMDEYAVAHNLNYPNDPTAMCEFIKKYLENETGPQPTCSPAYVGSKSCVLVQGQRFSICYHGINSSHAYSGPLDEISIQLGHWCNQGEGYHSVDGTSPITAGPTGSPVHELRRYAVWTRLEGVNEPICFDNWAN